MNALVYLKERTRMCDSIYACYECEFYKYHNDTVYPCSFIESEQPEEAIEIVDKWSAAHPPKERNWHKYQEDKE